MNEPGQWINRRGWPLLIMLTAVVLRLSALPRVPPGLTHDEADHGLTAWQILSDGVRDIYFTIGYGREPLYDYLTAVLMRLLGPTYFTGRLTAVFAGLILVAATYAWASRAFNRRIALLTMAGTAVAFWPVMTSRQMLRSTLLPPLMTLAAYYFWNALRTLETDELGRRTGFQAPLFNFLMAGFLLGLTFYVYIPARVLWGVFPAFALLLALGARPLLRRAWHGVLLLLLLAALVGLPLFRYLGANPGTEVRIRELSAPLSDLAAGDPGSLWENAAGSLRLFTVEGDPTWRYNVAGRPFLNPVLGILFYAGLLIALVSVIRGPWSVTRAQPSDYGLPITDYRSRITEHALPSAFTLLWLLAGLSPVLVTGPELSMTQAIGMQPVLYLFPALALDFFDRQLATPAAGSRWWPAMGSVVPLLIYGGTALFAARDYFVTWAAAPEVRVQYESTMVAMLHYVDERAGAPAAVSTVAPGWAHSPAVAQMVPGETRDLHWFDGRSSLLLPAAENSLLLFPAFAAPPPELQSFLETAVASGTIAMRPTDLDRPVAVYELDKATTLENWQQRLIKAAPTSVVLGDSLAWHGYALQPPEPAAGDVLQLITLWQVVQPLPHAQLFAHVWNGGAAPIAQADLLGVPGEMWRPGDWFLQLHLLPLPETAVGEFQIGVGLYSTQTGLRLPVTANSPLGDDLISLTTINVTP